VIVPKTSSSVAVSLCIASIWAIFPIIGSAQTARPDIIKELSTYDVIWNEPGKSSADSMPLGNGEIGLNVWTMPDGDLLFYIGKTDAWSEHPRSNVGLMKVGLLHVSLLPNPYVAGKPFVQILRLHVADVEIKEGKTLLRVWVDANHPVIHVEMSSDQPLKMKVELTPWYTEADKIAPPTILHGQKNEVAWFHRNGADSDPEVRTWTSAQS